MGAKKTSDLIPLCHPLPLSSVDVTLKLDDDAAAVEESFLKYWALDCVIPPPAGSPGGGIHATSAPLLPSPVFLLMPQNNLNIQ